jgi:hypothetical protein
MAAGKPRLDRSQLGFALMPELLDGRKNSSPHFGNRGIAVFEQQNGATSGKRAPTT